MRTAFKGKTEKSSESYVKDRHILLDQNIKNLRTTIWNSYIIMIFPIYLE